HVLALDPKRHPGACANTQVVIEDLLSLRIQTAFFEQGDAWCSVEYEAGTLRRYVWRHQSKRGLLEHVLAHAQPADVQEVAQVLVRVREMWGLPVDRSLLRSGETSAGE